MHHVHDEAAYRDQPIERRGCVIGELDGELAAFASLLAAATSHCCLWCAVEGHFAAADAKGPIRLAKNLADIHREIDIELGSILLALDNLLMERVWIDNVIDGGAAAGSKESIIEILADHDVIDADFRE